MEITIKEAVDQLVKALKEDPGYYNAWQANIAMSFQDEWRRKADSCPTILDTGDLDIHEIANDAAKNFLNLLCSEAKQANYIEVAERVYYHVNPETRMDVPNSAYILTEKWYHEWMRTDTDLELFDWIVKNKNGK